MKTKYIVALVLVVCVSVYTYNGCKPIWQFDHLEQNARRVITGPALQTWATYLFALYPKETSFRNLSELGTNFPQQLRGLAPLLGPHVFIHAYDDTNYPSYVQLYWGSGMLGAEGFMVGPTNFVQDTNFDTGSHTIKWQDGVYFYNRS